jgi:GntR family transcriptional regulator/MocR family aminotransferase
METLASASDPFRRRLDRAGNGPLYRQLRDRIRRAILDGVLQPGARLPSSRVLASQLAAARGTVERAYELLIAEGYLAGRAAAGTIVNPQLHGRVGRNTPVPARRPTAALTRPPRNGQTILFHPGLPALDAFPRKLWSRLAGRRARDLSATTMTYQEPAGYRPLREAIAGYLSVARGISTSAEQLFITAGFDGALALVARVLLERGERAWIEDPGYFRAREGLRLAGAVPVAVAVDAHGIRVDDGVRRAPDARLAYVTPSYQAPLGATLSLPRRLALLDWASHAGAWIVEDDYSGEFRYDGWPLPALKSLDTGERVFYVGSFSKTLFPALRLGYLIVPRSQVARFAQACAHVAPHASVIEQMAAADFLAAGHFARHVRRMRKLYAERRGALAAALSDAFGARLRIDPEAGGVHLVAWLRRGDDDTELARRAIARGRMVSPLSAWTIAAAAQPALLLGFTNVPVEAAAREARHLRRILYE